VSELAVIDVAGPQPPPIKTDALELRSANLSSLALEIKTISTREDYLKSRDLADSIRGMRTEIGQTFNKIIGYFHLGHKEALRQRDKYDGPLEKGEAHLSRLQGRYILEEKEKERRAAAERDRIEAEKRAAEEKALRLAQEAEQRAREEEEAKKRAAERAEQAQLAAARAKDQEERFKQERIAEEEKRISEAAAKREADARAEADRIVAEAAAAETKIVEEKPAVYDPGLGTGLAPRRNFKYEIINPALLPRDFLMPDETAIGIYVRKTKVEGLVLNGAVRSFVDPGTQRTGR
jgi:hypothetical protein